MDSLFYNFRGEKNLISRPDLEELEQRLGLQVIKKKNLKYTKFRKGNPKCENIHSFDTLTPY